MQQDLLRQRQNKILTLGTDLQNMETVYLFWPSAKDPQIKNQIHMSIQSDVYLVSLVPLGIVGCADLGILGHSYWSLNMNLRTHLSS